MEDGHPDEKVQMLIRGGDVTGDNKLSRNEFAALTKSIYLGALAMRGKTYDMNLIDAAHVEPSQAGQQQRFLPDGVEQSLQLLGEGDIDDWVNPVTGNIVPVAVLEGEVKDATLDEFAEVVGHVAANYAFCVANKEGDTLDIQELENWVSSDHESFQFIKQLFLATQTRGRNEREDLVDYLEQHHKVLGIEESDQSMLGLLKSEIRGVFGS